MKHIFSLLPVMAMLALACNKSTDTETVTTEPEDQKVTVQVLELETNKPIPGVTMNLKKCTKNDLEFGCLSYATVKTLTTNDSGKIRYSNKLRIEKIDAQHPKYWREVSSYNSIIMTPIATVKAHIKKVHTYPPTASLSIAAGTADCRNVYCARYINYQTIGLPTDTIVYLNAYGNLDNQVSWYTTEVQNADSLFETSRFRINGFDTVSVTVAY